jgi:hypothetical protein
MVSLDELLDGQDEIFYDRNVMYSQNHPNITHPKKSYLMSLFMSLDNNTKFKNNGGLKRIVPTTYKRIDLFDLKLQAKNKITYILFLGHLCPSGSLVCGHVQTHDVSFLSKNLFRHSLAHCSLHSV